MMMLVIGFGRTMIPSYILTMVLRFVQTSPFFLGAGDDGASRRHRSRRQKRQMRRRMRRRQKRTEKSPRNFVALLGRLGGAGFLRAHGLVPLMCGARSVEDYAGEIVEELRRLVTVRSSTASHRRSSSSEGGDEEVGEDVVSDDDVNVDVNVDGTWPCVALDCHMGLAELAAIFSRTAINVHVSVAIWYLGFFFPLLRDWDHRTFFRTVLR